MNIKNDWKAKWLWKHWKTEMGNKVNFTGSKVLGYPSSCRT